MNKPKLTATIRLSSLLRIQKDPKLALQLFRKPNHAPKPFSYNNRHYDLIITKLGRARMFDEMQQILRQLKHDTRVIPEESTLCNVISYYARAHLLQRALQVFDEMPSFKVQRTVKSFNALLNGLLTCGKIDLMKEVFRSMEKCVSPDAGSYDLLIHGYVANGRLEDAMNMFDEMLKREIKPIVVTFGMLISGLCLESRVDEALKLKEDMTKVHNVKPNGQVFSSLIKGLCAVGEWNLALGFKDEMMRNKMELDSGVYPTLISALFKAGRKDEVSHILKEMKKSEFKQNTVAYNALISGFCQEKDFKTASKLLDEMEGNANLISYNAILGGLCKEGKCSEVNDLFEVMCKRGCSPDVVSYRVRFDALCDGMQFKQAASVLDEMIAKGYVPRSDHLQKFLDHLCGKGNRKILRTVLNTLMKENAIDLDTWRTLICKICMDKKLPKTLQLAETLIRH